MAEQAPSGFRSTRLLAVAIVLAVAFVVLSYIQRTAEQRRRQRDQVSFVLVKRELSAGTALDAETVQEFPIPRLQGRLLKGLVRWDEIVPGRTVVKQPVAKNDLLRLVDINPAAGMKADVTEGLQSAWDIITLAVDAKGIPAGYIQRGSRVDVYGVLALPGKPPQTHLIIEYLEVMGADGRRRIDPRRGGFRTIDVQIRRELTPKMLEVARRVVGPMRVVVRRPDDNDFQYPYDPQDPANTRVGTTIAKPVMDSLAKAWSGRSGG